jgi:hypothetical protein
VRARSLAGFCQFIPQRRVASFGRSRPSSGEPTSVIAARKFLDKE